MRFFADFETRSRCNLKTYGLDNYAKDPSTEVICMAWAVDESPVQLWLPDEPLSATMMGAGFNRVDIWAHNAAFEFAIWNEVCARKYNFRYLITEQMNCTMVLANAMGFPSSLGNAAIATNLKSIDKESLRKDALGHRTMMMLCQPKKDGKFWEYEEVPEKFELLYEYCKTDLEVMRGLSKKLAPLNKQERKIWVLDQTINQRGVGIDLSLATNIYQKVIIEQERLNKEFVSITRIPSTNANVAFKKWIEGEGVELEGVAKNDVTQLLETELPENVRDALEIRKEAAKSSTAKFKAMINGQNRGRARNLFSYYGAKQTGRWAGRTIQLQNLKRPKLSKKELDYVLKFLTFSDGTEIIRLIHGSPMDTFSDCIRSMIVPALGNQFLVADYSNIEGRALAWLSGEKWLLKYFEDFDKGIGVDLYRLVFSKAFHVAIEKVTDEQRQIGKTLQLACIAKNEMVLTDKGLVAIQNVTTEMKVWDGVDFVNHDGVVSRGTKETITYEGLTATEDHLVWVEGKSEPVHFKEAAESGSHLLKSGSGWNAIRICKNYKPRKTLRERLDASISFGSMCFLRKNFLELFSKFNAGKKQGMPTMFSAEKNTFQARSSADSGKATMYESKRSEFQKLWWEIYSFQFPNSFRSRTMDNEKSGTMSERITTGPNKQRRSLREKQSPVGNEIRTNVQFPKVLEKVYDIINCGPRNRFTVSNALVHNCGYQGSTGAFQSMAKNLGVKVTDSRAKELVDAWREAHPKIKNYWYAVEEAAVNAIENPGVVYLVGNNYNAVKYVKKGSFLCCQLPTGRVMFYPYPKYEEIEAPWGGKKMSITYCFEESQGKKWIRGSTYGGSLVENITQGLCREILAEGMLRVEEAGYPVVAHVHDEIICEVPIAGSNHNLKEFERLVSIVPDWAKGFPISAKGYADTRYKKG